MKTKPNILVLGQNGLIGKKVFIFLKKKNFNLILYSKREEIFSVIKKTDIIINCAGNNNNNFYKDNVFFIKKILKFIKHNKILFIQISSLSVYGARFDRNRSLRFIDEKFYNLPKSNYGKSKLNAEIEIKKFSKNQNFKYIILRIGSIDSTESKNKLLIYIRKIIKFNFFVFLNNKNTILNLLSVNKLNFIINIIIKNHKLFINNVFNVCENITLYNFLLKSNNYKKFFSFNISNKYIVKLIIIFLSKILNVNVKKFNNLFLKNIYTNKKLIKILNKINKK